MIEELPLPVGDAAEALGRCAARVSTLLARGQLRQPSAQVGLRLAFGDGTSARVYRETVLEGAAPSRPAVLVVVFRLRLVRSEVGHALFRQESLLNTVLFAGFPGFVSKLWLRHDERHRYRGVYEWDDPSLAVSYVRALWRVLGLVSEPGSMHYAVLPGLRRHELLATPSAAPLEPGDEAAWWRLVAADAPEP